MTPSLPGLVRRFALLTALRWFPIGLYTPVAVLLMQARGLDLATVGGLYAIYGIVTVALELPTGGLADVVGRRLVLVVAAATTTLSLTIAAFAQVPETFAVAMVVGAVGRALGSGPLDAWFVDAVHAIDPEISVRGGLSRAASGEALALGLGAIIGGLLPSVATWVWPAMPSAGNATLVTLSIPALAAAALMACYGLAVVLIVHEVRPPWAGTRALVVGVPGTIREGVRLGLGDGDPPPPDGSVGAPRDGPRRRRASLARDVRGTPWRGREGDWRVRLPRRRRVHGECARRRPRSRGRRASRRRCAGSGDDVMARRSGRHRSRDPVHRWGRGSDISGSTSSSVSAARSPRSCSTVGSAPASGRRCSRSSHSRFRRVASSRTCCSGHSLSRRARAPAFSSSPSPPRRRCVALRDPGSTEGRNAPDGSASHHRTSVTRSTAARPRASDGLQSRRKRIFDPCRLGVTSSARYPDGREEAVGARRTPCRS